MILSLAGCGSSSTASQPASLFKAGTYEGTAKGFNGDITAVVTVSDNKIEKVEFKKHQESIGVSDPAFNTLPGLIIEKQTVAVDTVKSHIQFEFKR
jgi:fumarate reductase flavoprotein subunit